MTAPRALPHLLYCHGFGSGPETTAKGLMLRRELAPLLASATLPDLQGPDFFHLRLDDMARRLEESVAGLPDDGAPLLLAGSSLGAWLVANRATATLGRPAALLLVAPAFGFVSRWRDILGEEGLAQWRQQGSRPFYHHRSGSEQLLSVDFLDSCAEAVDQPPATSLPTVVIHGRQDEVVSWQQAFAYAEAAPAAEFHLLNEGHSVDSPAAQKLLLLCAQGLLQRLGEDLP